MECPQADRKPKPIIIARATLVLIAIWRFFRIKRGKKATSQSEPMDQTACAKPMACLISGSQVPGRTEFQIFGTGLQVIYVLMQARVPMAAVRTMILTSKM